MDYRTHRVAGICAGIMAGSFLFPQIDSVKDVALFGIILLASEPGSYLPDIDEPNSHYGRKIKPISKLIKSTAGHRGIMHYPITAYAILVILLLLKSRYVSFALEDYFNAALIGLEVGFLSHLMVDTLNVKGIRWFWPLSRRSISLMSLREDNKTHRFIVRFICILLSALTIIFVYFS